MIHSAVKHNCTRHKGTKTNRKHKSARWTNLQYIPYITATYFYDKLIEYTPIWTEKQNCCNIPCYQSKCRVPM